MRIFAIGDVVGEIGCAYVAEKLRDFKRREAVDYVVANGENSAYGNGITPKSAKSLFDAGVDVITTGNHVWARREIYEYIDENPYVIRPANYPDTAPGRGYCVLDTPRARLCVANIIGVVFMDSLESPFAAADRIMREAAADMYVFDFHAEATSEKKALGHYLDGRAAAVFGTHTHVQTADECILPGGTAYITDIGMTGPDDSVLGMKKESAIMRFITKMPHRFECAAGSCSMWGVLMDFDDRTRKAVAISRIRL